MTASPIRQAVVAAALALALTGPGLRAAEQAPLPPPGEVRSLAVYPERIELTGSDSSCQLIVTATLANGRLQDLSGAATFEANGGKLVRVTSAGRVLPLASGSGEVVVRYGPHSVTVPVQAERIEEDLPINFANQIVPIFSKLGCNSGGCHGKLSGQNGFRLSLLGFEPELDYMTLVKEGRGRRVFPAAPDNSLLLLKASGAVAHGGGKRMEVGSDEYRLIRRWVAAGMPYGEDSDPKVVRISVYPEHRFLTRQNHQQLAVYAHYSDGHVEDVTSRAQYDSNDTDIAVIDVAGQVSSLGLSGEAAIMARYLGQVTVFRATVPLTLDAPAFAWQPRNVIDQHTARKWRELGIVPSELCGDEEFLRRASLDIAGTLPTPAEVRAFLADQRPDKRDRLVDRLVDSAEYSYYFANRWADILRIRRGNQQQGAGRAFGTFVFHDWVRESLAIDRPYDEFARSILGAIGDEYKCPPTVWYKDMQTADQIVDNAAQVFLGTRLQCAQCHHHPYEKWSQEDYWGLAAFFGRLGRKNVPVAGRASVNQQQGQRQVLYNRGSGNVINKRSGKAALMKVLDGKPVEVPADVDPRHVLVDWLVAPDNPFFARAVANRYWAHFFGRGLVDPVDDMRVTNPPSNPELLDALAKELVEHKYSLKHLVRTICKSRTYQLSAVPNDFNKHDRQNYARYYPRRMSAEVLFDAVCQVTDSPLSFPGLPADVHAPRRAIMLPDESFQSYFLDVFGRPQRLSPCECERVAEANLAQVLHLLNSEEVQGKLARAGGRADLLARDPRPDAEKVEELFLWCVGHKPSPRQLELALAAIDRAKVKKTAYEDILWALINGKEFSFVK
jgi:hypothetical protein